MQKYSYGVVAMQLPVLGGNLDMKTFDSAGQQLKAACGAGPMWLK